MAKSKKSRRARRQATPKQRQNVVSQATKEEVVSTADESAVPEPAPEPADRSSEPSPKRKVVDFAKEYYYVYAELRNILIVAVVMFLLMVGLAFLI